MSEFFQNSKVASSYKKFRPEMPEECVDNMLKFLAQSFDLKVCVAADIGCGSGQSSFPVAVHLKQVIGIDMSEAQLKEADEADPRKINVEFRQGSAESLPLEDNSVHLVYCVFSAHWFDLPAFLKEADRVLLPGGVLAFCGTDYTMDFKEKWHQEAMDSYDHLLASTKTYWDKKAEEWKNFYLDLKSPYEELIWDHSVTKYEALTVKKFIDRIQTVSSVGKYLDDKPEEAKENILLFQNKLMELLKSNAPPEETNFIYGFHYVMLFCRKPL